MSTSPVEKPATRRGQSPPALPAKFEDKMMACSDDALETSPVEQQFVQRKQKYSSPLCQAKTSKKSPKDNRMRLSVSASNSVACLLLRIQDSQDLFRNADA